MASSPFTDPQLIVGPLYADANRLTRRTTALHAAKISGSDAAVTIAALARRALANNGGPRRDAVVCDIGCGRGSTTLALAAHLEPARLIALDQSEALLKALTARARSAGCAVQPVRADFHHLPLPTASLDLAVAAFCLYHSARPVTVLTELGRCLKADGRTVVSTKSADSYHDIDAVLAAADLDPDAQIRPSLYTAFPGEQAPDITAQALDIIDVITERHDFRFTDLEHLAAYIATTPKYRLPAAATRDPAALATALRARVSDRPLTTTSTVVHIVAAPR